MILKIEFKCKKIDSNLKKLILNMKMVANRQMINLHAQRTIEMTILKRKIEYLKLNKV